MSQTTREEVLEKLRRRYRNVAAEHKRKLLDQAQELLGYHRKAAIRSLRAPTVVRGPRIITGRPVMYEPALLQRWLRPIWAATDTPVGSLEWPANPKYYFVNPTCEDADGAPPVALLNPNDPGTMARIEAQLRAQFDQLNRGLRQARALRQHRFYRAVPDSP